MSLIISTRRINLISILYFCKYQTHVETGNIPQMGGAQTLFHSLCGHLPYTEWDCLGNVTTNPKCFEATQSLNRSTSEYIVR